MDRATLLPDVTLYKLKLIPAKPDRPWFDALRREHVFTPRILSQTRANRRFALGVDYLQGVVAVSFADRPSEDDESIVDERIHESRVLVPACLLTPPARVVPGGAFRACHKVIVSHGAYRLDGVDDGGRP
jgi:hypothetical protein